MLKSATLMMALCAAGGVQAQGLPSIGAAGAAPRSSDESRTRIGSAGSRAETAAGIAAGVTTGITTGTGAPVRPSAAPAFTFKRVRPPRSGAARRITVQIVPEEQERALRVSLPADPAPPKPSRTAWFWQAVSPTLRDASPARFQVAIKALSAAPEGGAIASPRLQDMQMIARAFGRDILLATVGTKVSPALVLAVIAVESDGREEASSSKGARGLMQLMPDTAARFGVDASVAQENIKGGVAYLDWLIERFDGDTVLALAGYNAGENAVARYEGVPPYAETRDYVPKVISAWNVARGLCVTPPQLAGDGCVFAGTEARG
ncbi:lytic transglycosylase domain-containing protein [Brevirhabdus sp.]|uniref:lytic transglycosylase domain-containing protein n=1 Tax=Brevirhabdus sp. TaxID=2004514 RepID=UPI004058DCFB